MVYFLTENITISTEYAWRFLLLQYINKSVTSGLYKISLTLSFSNLRCFMKLTVLPTANPLGSWWRRKIETFSTLLALCVGWGVGEFTNHQWIPLTKASDTELWCFLWSVICAWISCWVNNCEAGDLRCHHAHYDVTIMCLWIEGGFGPDSADTEHGYAQEFYQLYHLFIIYLFNFFLVLEKIGTRPYGWRWPPP